MARSKTTWSKDNPPRTGRQTGAINRRTKLLSALKKNSSSEEDFYECMVSRALDPKDPSSAMLAKEVMNRLYPQDKATAPLIQIDFENSDPVHQIDTVINAVGDGVIPSDIGQTIIGMIKDKMAVMEVTELAERLARLERILESKGDA